MIKAALASSMKLNMLTIVLAVIEQERVNKREDSTFGITPLMCTDIAIVLGN